MARQLAKLTVLGVKQIKKPGYYSDGGGLWLQVSRSGAKSWVFRFERNGRRREMGLGSLNAVSLASARDKAQNCRTALDAGLDPIEQKQAEKAAQRLEAAKSMTFDQCAAKYVEAHRAGWRNAKHADQWTNTLNTYASPAFGKLPVAAVDTGLVMRALQPIWTTKPETASRVRGRIESVLDWAAVHGYRQGDNPARWRGHLDKLLPRRSKVAKVQHHAALPYAEISDFMNSLRAQEGMAPMALEFAILTATRTNEVIGANWDEIDLEASTWAIPAERMKAHREHRAPLAPRALEILREAKKFRTEGDYVFPGLKMGKPLSNNALLAVLKRMERADLTAHGFRSTFRDWCSEQTNHPREVAEAALAHVLKDKTEAAYMRGDLFTKRKRLMNDWASYCAQGTNPSKKVVPIRANLRKAD